MQRSLVDECIAAGGYLQTSETDPGLGERTLQRMVAEGAVTITEVGGGGSDVVVVAFTPDGREAYGLPPTWGRRAFGWIARLLSRKNH